MDPEKRNGECWRAIAQRQIRQQLRESGLTPLSVSTASASASATQSRRFTLAAGHQPDGAGTVDAADGDTAESGPCRLNRY